MSNSAFTPTVLTISSGAGSGNGEKNYITNPSMASATTGWNVIGDFTLSRSTSSSELPREYTTATGIKIVAASGTQSAADYVYFDFNLDDVDLNRKLKIQWSQKKIGTFAGTNMAVVITSQSDRTTALYTPVTTAIPAIDGDFQTSFDSASTAALSLVIRGTSTDMTTGDGICISDVIVGPGEIVQGAVVSDWVDFTPTLKGSTSDPSLGTTGQAQYGRYIRIGGNAKIRYNWRFGTTSPSFGSGTYYFLMPTGLTVDTSRLEASSNNNANPVIGHGYITDDSLSVNYLVEVVWDRTNDRLTMLAGSNGVAVTQLAPMTFAAQDSIIIEIEVPVSEWSGSGTVNLGPGAQVEYASVGGTWDADSTTTVYGPAGSSISGALTGPRLKTITWQYPIQADDQIIVEASQNQSVWFPINFGAIGPANTIIIPMWNNTLSNFSGITIRPGTANNQTIIYFGQYAAIGNDGTTLVPWPSSSAYWRVRKAKASSPVGFGKADSTSFGLVGPRKGSLVITSSNQTTYFSSLPSGFSMTRGVFIYYQDQDSNHRLKFNLVGSMASATSATLTWSSSGVVFKSGLEQAVLGWSGTSSSWSAARATGSSLNYWVSAASTYVSLSGDVELESKPTWA